MTSARILLADWPVTPTAEVCCGSSDHCGHHWAHAGPPSHSAARDNTNDVFFISIPPPGGIPGNRAWASGRGTPWKLPWRNAPGRLPDGIGRNSLVADTTPAFVGCQRPPRRFDTASGIGSNTPAQNGQLKRPRARVGAGRISRPGGAVTMASIGALERRTWGETRRRDLWWLTPLAVFLGLSGFIVYATWAALQGDHYTFGPYLSPFYSPEIFGGSPHSWFGPKPGWWPGWLPFSPAILILWAP